MSKRKKGRVKIDPDVLAKSPAPKITDPGTITMMTMYHDDWCDLLARRGPCNCDPEYKLTTIQRPGQDN